MVHYIQLVKHYLLTYQSGNNFFSKLQNSFMTAHIAEEETRSPLKELYRFIVFLV